MKKSAISLRQFTIEQNLSIQPKLPKLLLYGTIWKSCLLLTMTSGSYNFQKYENFWMVNELVEDL